MTTLRGLRKLRRCIASALSVTWFFTGGGVALGQDFSMDYDVAADEEVPCPPSLKASYLDPGTGLTFFGVARLTMRQEDEYGRFLYTYQFEGYTVDRHQKIVGFAHIAPQFCVQAYYAFLRKYTVPIGQLHNATLYQVACNEGGSGPTAITAVDYEYTSPYDDPNPGGTCSESPSNEESGGSSNTGPYYEPGDYTGGETVDWNTGQGNGGSSVCGPAAVVEYICIDTWDGEKWVEWSCGYATTC